MKTPAKLMANKGVSSYEHMMDSPRAAHHGSKNSEPHSASGGTAPGPTSPIAPSSTHNFSGGGAHTGTIAKSQTSEGGGYHNLGM